MIYHLEAYHGAQEAELKHLHSQVCDEVRCWKDSAGKPEESIYQPSRAWLQMVACRKKRPLSEWLTRR